MLLLPHGFEGQGPDHSSARVERFLQLCAEENMIVAMPSTPANYFHLLRRQAYARPRKPLVVATPKSMLRLRAAASGVEDFTTGTFQPVMGEAHLPSEVHGDVDRVLLCSGKVYYDLLAERAKRADERTAVVRLEQLYPADADAVREALAPFGAAELVWVQEEPANQGAWTFVREHLEPELDRPLRLVSRPASASPATGSTRTHVQEQTALIEEALRR